MSLEKIHTLQLIRSRGIGAITFHRLVERFGSASEAVHQLPEFIKETQARSVSLAAQKQAEKELDTINKRGFEAVTWSDASYPEALKPLEDAPPVLICRGNIQNLQAESVAIVGARNASIQARKFAAKLARELSQAGYVVTSGFARGIDTSVHEAASNGLTTAVMAGGVDIIYPPENKNLYKSLCEEGLCVSECPLGEAPTARHFPRRNRIIAGLSRVTIVVEAAKRSGSLITARLAAEMGRDVGAVPGFPGDPRSEGANSLIKDGASVITSVDDVLELLSSPFQPRIMHQKQQTTLGLELEIPSEAVENNEVEAKDLTSDQKMMSLLSKQAVHIDELVRGMNVPVQDIQTALLKYELEGKIQRLPGNRVSLKEPGMEEYDYYGDYAA